MTQYSPYGNPPETQLEKFYAQTEQSITLTPGETKMLRFPAPQLLNFTLYIQNATSIAATDTLQVQFQEYYSDITTTFTLNSVRYGVYVDNDPTMYLKLTNISQLNSIVLYYNIVQKQMMLPFSSTIQFIVQLTASPPVGLTTLWYGTNNRYQGTLSNATFLVSVPVSTTMAVRSINSIGTSSSAVGIVEIPFAADITYYTAMEPLGASNTNTTFVFVTDSLTNGLPASSTITNASVQSIIIDYYFSYSVTNSFSSTYTITNGATTTIQWSGTVFAYYFTNSSLPLSGVAVVLTNSNNSYTLSPTSGTTNNSGNLTYTATATLNSSLNLSSTVTSSNSIAGITEVVKATIPSTFGYTTTLVPTNPIYVSLDGATSVSSSGTVTLTTTNANDIIEVVVSYTNYTGTPGAEPVPTATGLTFNTRTFSYGNINGYQLVSFYAVASSALTNVTITVPAPGSGGNIVDVIAFGISGTNTTSPFDSNSGLPNNQSGSGISSGTAIDINTSNGGRDLIVSSYFTIYGQTIGNNSFTPPSGASLIAQQTPASSFGSASMYSKVIGAQTNYNAGGMTWSGGASCMATVDGFAHIQTNIVTITVTSNSSGSNVVLGNQVVNLKLTQSSTASFSNSSVVQTTQVTTNASGIATVNLYNSDGSVLTATPDIAGLQTPQTLNL